MATPNLNPIFDGLSGAIGKLVFSQRYGKTIVSRKPAGDRIFSPEQLTQQEKVKLSGAYVKAVAANPQARAPYEAAAEARNVPLVGLISGDFLNTPVVNSIDVSGYTGQPGSIIVITATDDFEVMGVDVEIKNAGGDTVEEGAAALSVELPGRWVYTASGTLAAGTPYSVIAAASDRPGNIGKKTESVQ